MRNLEHASVERVTVFRTGNLGDTICAIPAFRLIRQHFASAHVTLLCDRAARGNVAAAEVIRDLGLFDRIRTYTARAGAPTLGSLFWQVKSARPDVLVMLPQGREASAMVSRKQMFFRVCGIRDVRAGQIRTIRDGALPNESDRLIELLQLYGIFGSKPPYSIPVENNAVDTVARKALAVGLDVSRPFIVFCGGGKAATQRWQIDRYAAVLRQLVDQAGIQIAAIGAPSDVETYRRSLLPVCPQAKIMEHLVVGELFPLLRLSIGYFGNDTGPMHMAAAIGKPVAVVMSGRNLPGEWDPDVEQRLIFRRRVSCENCFLKECVEQGHRCMTNISIAEVAAGVVPFFGTFSDAASTGKVPAYRSVN